MLTKDHFNILALIDSKGVINIFGFSWGSVAESGNRPGTLFRACRHQTILGSSCVFNRAIHWGLHLVRQLAEARHTLGERTENLSARNMI